MWRWILSCLAGCLVGAAIAGPALAGDVTLVLVLEPKKFSGKAWDIGRGADPILCVGGGCYRSAGLDRPSRYLPGRRALGPLAALNVGGKAGACADRLGCVFRALPLEDGPVRVMPVDVDIDRHDRLENSFVAADRSCRVRKGHLDCYNGIYTREYSLWVVPEEVADQAGYGGLDYALHEGIREGRERFGEEMLSQEREAMPQRIADFYQLVLGEEIGETCRADIGVMSGTLRLAGIDPSSLPGAGAAMERFIHSPDASDMLETIRTEPRVFWGLRQALDRLRVLISVDDVTRTRDFGGLRVVDRSGKAVLEVGWRTEEAARDLIDRCEGVDATDLDSIFRAEDRG
ncbi:MAG: hypothetical protein R3D57_01145 [Hyphomicrobiaceae bacterium]